MIQSFCCLRCRNVISPFIDSENGKFGAKCNVCRYILDDKELEVIEKMFRRMEQKAPPETISLKVSLEDIRNWIQIMRDDEEVNHIENIDARIVNILTTLNKTNLLELPIEVDDK